LDKGKFLVKG